MQCRVYQWHYFLCSYLCQYQVLCRYRKRKAVLRRLIRVSESITNECYQDTENLDQLLEQTEKQIFDVVQNRSTSDFVPIRQVALETLESIQNAAKTVGAVTRHYPQAL